MKLSAPNLLGAIVAALAAHMGPTPLAVKVLGGLFVLLLVVDSATGIACAAFAGQLRSRTMRSKFAAKFSQYALVVFCAFATGVIVQTWWVLHGILGMVCAAEVTSILENARRLETAGGMRLPSGISAITEKLAPFLAQTGEHTNDVPAAPDTSRPRSDRGERATVAETKPE